MQPRDHTPTRPTHHSPLQEEAIEKTIGFGQLEELIEQGKDEMELMTACRP